MQNGPKHFFIGKQEVQRVAIDPREEMSGKHVDTKVEFKVDDSKIIVHVYNTKQKVMIQGSKFQWFVENYLEPFFKLRITNCIPQIESINKTILSSMKPKKNTNKTVNLEESTELIVCDRCEFSTTSTKELRGHIVSEHTVNLFQDLEIQTNSLKEIEQQQKQDQKNLPDGDIQSKEKGSKDPDLEKISNRCEKCEYETTDRNDFDQHVMIHKAEAISESLHKCPKCNNSTIEMQKLQCNSCCYFFHKQCTNRKGKGGRAPKDWNCEFCQSSQSKLNVNAMPFVLPSLTNTTSSEVSNKGESIKHKFPTLTGKHRKSGLCEHPDIDFLEMQIETLKSTIAQKDLETAKLKQSDSLKTKQINNLEAKLQEALKTIKLQNNVQEKSNDSVTNKPIPDPNVGENFKIHFLENKTSSLELQLGLLSSRLDSLLFNFVGDARPAKSTTTMRNPEPMIRYVCEICNFEVTNKTDMEKHKQEKHARVIACQKCDFETTKLHELKTHKALKHPPIKYSCDNCDFDTMHANQLEKHKRTIHTEDKTCDKTNFKEQNEKDLSNHISSKHDTYIVCELCKYEANGKPDLTNHKRRVHNSRYFIRSQQPQINKQIHYKTQKKEPLKVTDDTTQQSEPKDQFYCVGNCDSIQKTFTHKDELELHKQYYHKRAQSAGPQ